MIICIVLCIILSTTPVTASVQDNLNLAISKLIGQKNETTTQAAYGNASTNAKLNYLESRVRNIESTLGSISTSSGSVPKCVDSRQFVHNVTFTGPGVLYVHTDIDSMGITVDDVPCESNTFLVVRDIPNGFGNAFNYVIPFKNNVSVNIGSIYDTYVGYYTLYKY